MDANTVGATVLFILLGYTNLLAPVTSHGQVIYYLAFLGDGLAPFHFYI